MILSEERQQHLASVIIDGIWNDDLVEYSDEDAAMRIAKKAVADWVKEEADLDQTVRDKVGSLKRNLIENTAEWEIMYSKYYEEEMVRRGYKK